ncbi:MAG: universal stress protein, partial [Acidimicrobiales bacterium]
FGVHKSSDIVDRAGLDGVEIAVVQGEAVDELIRFGDKVDADLLVVGHHDTMAPGGFGQHGPAEGLLRSSRMPFVVVDERSPLPDPDRDPVLVVGVDGSKANAESVEAIARIASDLRATCVPVLSVNTGASTTRDRYGSHLLHEDDAAAITALLPGDAELRTINESPVQGLIDEADDVGALLIAIGTKGHWTLGDLFAGQITRHVIEHAHRAVLVAPHVS